MFKQNRIYYWVFIFCCSFLFSAPIYALTFTLPANGANVVGKVQLTYSMLGDDFSKLGRRYDIGYYQLVEANPGIDPALPVAGTLIVVPTRFILPHVPYTGIVVNLAELRIYYFPPGTNKVLTYPVGIGREGWETPLGVTSVIQKVVNPTWVVPQSIKAWRASQGVQLPDSIAPGPDNPLGGYAMYLGFPGYRIHGSNDPSGIGRRSSSGCIRMWPEDVEEMFSLVTTGTQVRVIDDPYKAGWLDDKLYLESHTPLQDQQSAYGDDLTLMTFDVQAVAALHPGVNIDWDAAQKIAKQQNGVPQVIGAL